MFDTTNETLREVDRLAKYARHSTCTLTLEDRKRHIVSSEGSPSLLVIEEHPDGLGWFGSSDMPLPALTLEQVRYHLMAGMEVAEAVELRDLMTDEDNSMVQYDIWTGRSWFLTETVSPIMDEKITFTSTHGRERTYGTEDFLQFRIRPQGRRPMQQRTWMLPMGTLFSMVEDGEYMVLKDREWVVLENAEMTADGKVIFGEDHCHCFNETDVVAIKPNPQF